MIDGYLDHQTNEAYDNNDPTNETIQVAYGVGTSIAVITRHPHMETIITENTYVDQYYEPICIQIAENQKHKDIQYLSSILSPLYIDLDRDVMKSTYTLWGKIGKADFRLRLTNWDHG